jgi:hypothetical protein
MERPSMFMERGINIAKMTILPKIIYRFNSIFTKMPMIFSMEVEKWILKFLWNHERPWTVKEILSKKSNAGGIKISNFKVYYRAM